MQGAQEPINAPTHVQLIEMSSQWIAPWKTETRNGLL